MTASGKLLLPLGVESGRFASIGRDDEILKR
jgi:hypothetical protein